MKDRKRSIERIILTAALVVGIALAFGAFIRNNGRRIARQNEEYLFELTTQRAISIDSMISENLTFIRSTAYLYGRSLSSPWADVAVIRDYEENSVFDHLRFVDASGDDYTSLGVMANLSDRPYFQAGMAGESGVTYVPASRVTGEKQIGFYAPVYYGDDIIGVMLGFYGEAYIESLLEYSLFGYEGEGWLLDRQGAVLGSTTDVRDNFITALSQAEACSEEEIARVAQAVAAGENTTFTFREGDGVATGYAAALRATDWVLIRSFPPSASRQILSAANGLGVRLIAELVALFAVYVAALVIGFLLAQKKMKLENRDAADVSAGVAKLFDRLITVDLGSQTCRCVGGRMHLAKPGTEGTYREFVDSLLERVPEATQREQAAQALDPETLRESLRQSARYSMRVHAPTLHDEWYTYNFIAIEREAGEARRLLVASQDVTALYQREQYEQERLQAALREAERASRAKTEFLFNMSHDLRTPMNAIIGYTTLAQRPETEPAEVLDCVGKIDASSKHLLALINDILEMSRIESGKIELEPAPLDLPASVRSAGEIFTSQMREKGVEFVLDVPAAEDPWALCDGKRLNRVVLNLASNAFKFTPQGGRVTLSLRQVGKAAERSAWELRVRDTGIGMQPEFVSKLFVPFERERTSTVSGIQGTGLGLSITKRLVDLMGGSIDVTTAPGVGTQFTVSLTFPVAQPPAEAQAAGEREETSFDGVRLLVVEDNEINREIARMILTGEGFAVEMAENGKIAVDRLAGAEEGEFDAVLMDVQMPVMDGYAATRAIRALDNPAVAGIPIIAMTANAFREDVEAALAAGMDDHIAKPLDIGKMLKTIRAALARSGKTN